MLDFLGFNPEPYCPMHRSIVATESDDSVNPGLDLPQEAEIGWLGFMRVWAWELRINPEFRVQKFQPKAFSIPFWSAQSAYHKPCMKQKKKILARGCRVRWLASFLDGMASYFHFLRRGHRMDSEETLILGEDTGMEDVDDGTSHAVTMPVANPMPVASEAAPASGPPDGEPTPARVTSDAPPVPARPRPKTMRQMAARGANQIGTWTRKRTLAPHMPKGTFDFWVEDYEDHGEKFKQDFKNVIRKYKRERLPPVEFFSWLDPAICFSSTFFKLLRLSPWQLKLSWTQ